MYFCFPFVFFFFVFLSFFLPPHPSFLHTLDFSTYSTAADCVLNILLKNKKTICNSKFTSMLYITVDPQEVENQSTSITELNISASKSFWHWSALEMLIFKDFFSYCYYQWRDDCVLNKSDTCVIVTLTKFTGIWLEWGGQHPWCTDIWHSDMVVYVWIQSSELH